MTLGSGAPILLECADFVLRTMTLDDAALDWGGWLANPTTARMLNTKPRALDLAERQAYVRSFDSRSSHLVGIWTKGNDRLIGFWSIYVDFELREFLFNVLIGDASDRALGAQKQTSDAIYEYFFDKLGMSAVRCTVAGQNDQMIAYLRRRRWKPAGVTSRPSATGDRRVEIHHFRLSREDWRARFEDGWTEAAD
ncbi:MAG: GNAT family N-acetyltransferase [Alphaproteobacteria bacterium]|nr:GNAT family N-acetyltransferase [Alphaproteobacteria bacterium]